MAADGRQAGRQAGQTDRGGRQGTGAGAESSSSYQLVSLRRETENCVSFYLCLSTPQ